MRWHFALTLAAAAALPLGSAAQSLGAAATQRFVGNNLSASVFENLPGGGYRYVYISGSQSLSVKGDVERAQVNAYQSYADATGWGFRQVWCNVPGSALDVRKNSGGRLAATLDSAHAQCTSQGARYDATGGQTGTWRFAAEPVSLALSSPQYTTEADSRVVSNDAVSGITSRDNCRTFTGYGASGVMVLGPQTWNLAPATSSGYLYESACNSKVR